MDGRAPRHVSCRTVFMDGPVYLELVRVDSSVSSELLLTLNKFIKNA